MKRMVSVFSLLLASVCASASFAASMSEDANAKRLTQTGTLSIFLSAAPAVGLPDPKIMVTRNFTVYLNTAPWGLTWNLPVPGGTYRIHPLPVVSGSSVYGADSTSAVVPADGVVNKTITYRLL